MTRVLSWGWRHPLATLGLLLFGGLSGRQVLLFGSTWTFGRPHGLPKSLVNADATRYANGDPVDPFTRALILNGQEEQAYLALLVFLAAAFAWAAWQGVAHYRRLDRALRSRR